MKLDFRAVPSAEMTASTAAINRRHCRAARKFRQCMALNAVNRSVQIMRTCGLLLSAVLCGVLGGCSALGHEPMQRTFSPPPAATALEAGIAKVAKTVNWTGRLEASPVRQAHPLAPGDWIVCAQRGVRDLSPPYAIFFDGDAMVHFRIAVEVDDCLHVPYAPVAALGGAAAAPPAATP